MKALSLYQPWAYLLAIGLKTIECRNWTITTSEFPFLIHAPVKVDKTAYELLKEKFKLPPLDELPRGSLIGKAWHAGVKEYPTPESFWEDGKLHCCEDPRYFLPARFGHLVKRAELFKKPIPYAGNRKLFNVPDEVLRVCRVCGCSEYNACPGGCSWVEQDMCSACNCKSETPNLLKDRQFNIKFY